MPAKTVGGIDDLLDPFVALALLEVEELLGGTARYGLEDRLRGQLTAGEIDEPLVAEDHEVVDEVMPSHLRLDMLLVGHHVGVEPVNDVTFREHRAGVARVR